MDILEMMHLKYEKKHYLKVGAVSDIGCFRHENEDNYLVGGVIKPMEAEHGQTHFRFLPQDNRWHLIGVFDGMGGGEKGEVAAQIAAEAFRRADAALGEIDAKEKIDNLMQEYLLQANRQIAQLQQICGIYGTTATLVCTDGAQCKIYHLGDSRAYLLREGELCQLTQDQTLAQMRIDIGFYTADDPRAMEESHLLTDYVGKDDPELRFTESAWFDLQEQDRMLLCSDGLYGSCTRSQIHTILAKANHAEAAAKKLVCTALANGGQDNTTCIVVM